jgi:23S rRNA (pseudouridine1915-N3)-methyltransferase
VGKANEPYVKAGIELFTNRISHYYPIDWKIIPSPKTASAQSINNVKKIESENILRLLNTEDTLIALDEKGKQISSEQLAFFIQKKANERVKDITFLIGGAYGFNEDLKKRANLLWSLSPLVFPHQLVRLILAEQIYRACTIIKNEKYHHS